MAAMMRRTTKVVTKVFKPFESLAVPPGAPGSSAPRRDPGQMSWDTAECRSRAPANRKVTRPATVSAHPIS